MVTASVGRLVDTGASVSLVSRSFLPQNRLAEGFHIGFPLRGVDGNAASICGRLELPVQRGRLLSIIPS